MPTDDRAPSIQFYPRDWQADPAVQGLTFDQRGRYHWAWCSSLQTRTPGIASERQWQLWMGYDDDHWQVHRSAHATCFKVCSDGTWIQRRTKAEHKSQRNRYRNARKGAAVTNNKRWGKVAERQKSESRASAPASALESKSKPGTPCLPASAVQSPHQPPSPRSLPATPGEPGTPGSLSEGNGTPNPAALGDALAVREPLPVDLAAERDRQRDAAKRAGLL